MKRASVRIVTERDFDIVWRVLNGATLRTVGELYGLSVGRTQLIVSGAMLRFCRDFHRQHVRGIGLGANRLKIYRAHKDELLPLLKAHVGAS